MNTIDYDKVTDKIIISTVWSQENLKRLQNVATAQFSVKNQTWSVAPEYAFYIADTFYMLKKTTAFLELIASNIKPISEEEELEAYLNSTFNGRTLFEHQKEGIKHQLSRKRSIVAADMGTGKGQKLDAKILTPAGWTTMGNLRLGDEVINSLGEATKIIGIYPQGIKDIYKISFSDGTFTECDEEHLWMVQTTNHRVRKQGFLVKSLKKLNSSPLHMKNGNAKWYIPIVEPIKAFSKKELLIDPYLLGLLLGDGRFTTNSISFTSADKELIDYVKNNIFPLTLKYTSKYGYILSKGKQNKIKNHLIIKLKTLGLMGLGSHNKFIPKEYKFSTIENRLAILQGLMDTDGSISGMSKSIEFCSTSKQLTEDIVFIIQSLGGTATKAERYTYYTYKNVKKKGKLSYRLNISLPNKFNPFKLTRKAIKVIPKTKYFPSRNISNIKYVGKEKTQCIKVESKDSMYLTNDCIVTHNTLMALAAVKRLGLPVHVIAPVSLHENWKKEAKEAGVRIRKLMSSSNIGEPPNHEIALIVDECHYYQNEKSNRTRAFLNYVNKASFLSLLSGTPVKNGRPANLYPLLVAIRHPIVQNKGFYFNRYCRIHKKKGQKKPITTGGNNLIELHNFIADSLFLRTKKECLDLPEKLRVLRTAEPTDEEQGMFDFVFKALRERYFERVKTGKIKEANEALNILTAVRHAASWAKVSTATTLVKELTEEDRPVVLFMNYKDSAEALKSELETFTSCAILTSEVNVLKRDTLINDFQAGKYKVLIATYGTGGVGVTLTAASDVLLVDRPWTSCDAVQAEDRLHRIGTTENVTAIWIQNFRIDKHIDEILIEKQKNINEIITGKRDTLEFSDNISSQAEQILAEIFK